jgi:membrane-associated phospholipid phosphatase
MADARLRKEGRQARSFCVSMPAWKLLWWCWVVFITISCITTRMHGIVDVLIGSFGCLFVIRLHRTDMWEAAKRLECGRRLPP